MDKLLEALKEKAGITTLEGLDEKQVMKVARSLGIDPVDHIPRKPAELVVYTNKRNETNHFVKTDKYIVGRKPNGMAETVSGLFLRKEALDQVIEDLTTLRDSLKDE